MLPQFLLNACSSCPMHYFQIKFSLKKICEDIAKSEHSDYVLQNQTKRKADFPSPPRKYIKGVSQSPSIYSEDIIPLTLNEKPLSPGSKNSISPPFSDWSSDYTEEVLKLTQGPPYECAVKNCPVCLLSPEKHPSQETLPDRSSLQNPSPPTSLSLNNLSDPESPLVVLDISDSCRDPERSPPLFSKSVSIF